MPSQMRLEVPAPSVAHCPAEAIKFYDLTLLVRSKVFSQRGVVSRMVGMGLRACPPILVIGLNPRGAILLGHWMKLNPSPR